MRDEEILFIKYSFFFLYSHRIRSLSYDFFPSVYVIIVSFSVVEHAIEQKCTHTMVTTEHFEFFALNHVRLFNMALVEKRNRSERTIQTNTHIK